MAKEASMLSLIIGTIVIGLIVGLIGRLIVPGRDPMGIGGTILLGIAGSVIGGFIGRALFPGRQGGHFILAVIVAALLILILRRTGYGRRRAI
jgi:uncharacterized membrane protein YeaQ/YmgE (transglycosylase-associated protein family)